MTTTKPQADSNTFLLAVRNCIAGPRADRLTRSAGQLMGVYYLERTDAGLCTLKVHVDLCLIAFPTFGTECRLWQVLR
jgi:hypothetical protein